MFQRCLLPVFVLALLSAPARAAEAKPFLSPIFGDHMVLQRDQPNRFWGWTAPGENVTVQIENASERATAGADGRWEISLRPPKAGGPYLVSISASPVVNGNDGSTDAASGRGRKVELHDVLVGDVWLCGGQSNMEFGIKSANGGPEAAAAAHNKKLRLFSVKSQVGYSPKSTVAGEWKVATPEALTEGYAGFSAVAYFFAQRVMQDVDVPIGLIQDAVGGTPAETWTSSKGLEGIKDFAPQLAEIARLREKGAPEYGNYIMHWYDEYDVGIRGKNWSEPSIDDSDWKTVSLMKAFDALKLADVPAVVWLRREIVVPNPLPAGRAVLHLGVVEKMDTSFVNGRWVGASSWVENPRAYTLPPDVLVPGRNQIELRVLKLKSRDAFLSKPEDIYLQLGDGTKIPLAGEWKAKVSVDARAPHPLPLGYENYPTMPTVLNNGMLQPLAPMALAGVLWYQGEANAERAYQYRTVLPAMIEDWRRSFRNEALPFYIVSLPAFQTRKKQPGSDGWAELREAQALTAKKLEQVDVAVTIDTGEADNIHPKEKKIVGERLALLALADYYKKDVMAHGPRFVKAEQTRNGTALRVHFANAEGGLVNRGEEVGEFSVAGDDLQWHWAKAVIDGETVIVSAPDVPHPRHVRYAWQANPLASLYNKSGLPAEPFRSDEWPYASLRKK
ncbi:MAG TPA: sialate O-acetylesterase [Opitutaceae bacterium]|nr:sialate O-acetylesterase [Opitutaceae bacterium]